MRSYLLGVSGRALRLTAGDGEPLLYAAHEKLRPARLQPGDRVYLGGFADGKLALLGRVAVRAAVEPSEASIILREPVRAFCALGGAPFTSRQVHRIVPEDVARALRTSAGGGLRFNRKSRYELHPGALLGVTELEPSSAGALDELLDEVSPPPDHLEPDVRKRAEDAVAPRGPAEKSSPVAPRPNAERDAEIVAARAGGATVAEVARRFELSRQRIEQITARARAASRLDQGSGRLVRDAPAGKDRRERHRFSEADLVAAIRRAAEHYGRMPSAREYRMVGREAGLPSAQTIENRFGGWRAAVRAAGMSPPSELEPSSADGFEDRSGEVLPPPGRLEGEVQHRTGDAETPRGAAESFRGVAPLPQAERDAEIVAARAGGATVAEVARRFELSPQRIRQITARARTAGRLDPGSGRLVGDGSDREGGRERCRFSDADLVVAIRGAAEHYGRTPSAREYREVSRGAGLPSAQTIENRFGGWRAAVHAAGMSPQRARRTPRA